MKRSEAIEICLEHVEFETVDDFLSALISDQCHNVAICAKCKETFDIEPDVSVGKCPDCDGKYYTLTFLAGVPI